MSVTLIPECNKCYKIGVGNNTFYDMVNRSGMDAVIGKQGTNTPLKVFHEVSHADTLKLLALLREWEPPKEWASGTGAKAMKDVFIEFFKSCRGFKTQ